MMNNAALHRLDTYTDFSGLNALKQQARSDKEAALEAVSKQFESLFVSMMLKSMRDANKVFSEGNMLNSNESEFYQQMFDSQLSVSMSEGKGIGIAEMVKKQLSKDLSNQGLPLDRNENRAYSLEGYVRKHHPAVVLSAKEVNETMEKVERQTEQLNETVLLGNEPARTAGTVDFSSPEKFVESLYPLAKQVEQDTGISAKLMVAQAALETGWGRHQIQGDAGQPSHNLFGIKAHGAWSGDSVNIVTTEFRAGIPMKERAEFRAYQSFDESFKDYAKFLQTNPRYDGAFAHLNDPEAFAHALEDSGYATDPLYGEKINNIMTRIGNSYVSPLADLQYREEAK